MPSKVAHHYNFFGRWPPPVAGAIRHAARRHCRAYLGALAAGAVKLAGNASGLFEDGEVLEWSLCVLGAMTAVAVTVSLGSHPFCR
ncbi:hypothetical protein IHE31_05180 [Mycetohabitans rhizoxinica]|uniref:hypothetical protein n=1 Tax=Mycetohabitans rhizoxinica TaxID=412963 RepID=UPI0030CD46B6